MDLSQLKVGQRAVIQKVHGTGQFRKRILEMGFVQGKEIITVQNTTLYGPIHYKILGYDVSLRRADAKQIDIKVLGQESLKVLDEEELNLELEHHGMENTKPFSPNHKEDKKLNRIRVALVGNPNCGKTSLFNQVSGANEHVGNYSGVTVEAKTGYILYGDYRLEIIDLPGTYSLSPYSPEELYIREYLTGDKKPDIILNVLDACNLERNLYLTLQLKEMGLPIVGALNMFDELERRKDLLDYPTLSALLGVPMIPTICRTGIGLGALFDELISLYEGVLSQDEEWLSEEQGRSRPLKLNYGVHLEPAIEELSRPIRQHYKDYTPMQVRHLAIKILENDRVYIDKLTEDRAIAVRYAREESLKALQQDLGAVDTEEMIADARYGFISGALRETYRRHKQTQLSLNDKLDHIVTHKFLGFPIFLVLMYLMFYTTFELGAIPMDWIDSAVGSLGELISNLMPDGPIKDLVIDGIIAGVGGVIIFLPNILILYLFISFFEDSGYMARAAFIMDKLMHKMGLHGKSFIPLVMGFGCNVPAIMATRSIESRKSRIITMLVLPFMSCSARLPVYILIAGALFPQYSSLVLFGLYLFGIAVAIISARLMRDTLFSGEDVPFVMELPPYRLPTFRSILRQMWLRAKQYLQKMGTVILFASIVIWFLGYFPRQDEARTQLDKEIAQIEQSTKLSQEEKAEQTSMLNAHFTQMQQEQSYIGRLGKFTEPALSPLGFDWKMSISLLSGLAAKEVVVSTLGVIYTGNNDDSDEATARLSERIKQEQRPDGTPSFTPLVAISFLIFVLIYFPCVATIIAIAREAGSWKWGAFTVIFSCGLAWLLSFLVYQIGSLFI